MELVESKVDVIVAVAGIGGKEAKQATSTIPSSSQPIPTRGANGPLRASLTPAEM
jgi:hypothetical protein